MANYNIEMQYYNGSEYDVLYPNIPISAVSDWNDNVYSKDEINNKIGNASYSMDLFGTYIVTATKTDTGGSTLLPDNLYDGIFEREYDGFYFIINYTSGNLMTYNYILEFGAFPILPIYGTDDTEISIATFLPIVSKTIFNDNAKVFMANSFYRTNRTIGTLFTALVETNNNMEYIDLLELDITRDNKALSLLPIRGESGSTTIKCTVNVSIYKYKLNLNT